MKEFQAMPPKKCNAPKGIQKWALWADLLLKSFWRKRRLIWKRMPLFRIFKSTSWMKTTQKLKQVLNITSMMKWTNLILRRSIWKYLSFGSFPLFIQPSIQFSKDGSAPITMSIVRVAFQICKKCAEFLLVSTPTDKFLLRILSLLILIKLIKITGMSEKLEMIAKFMKHYLKKEFRIWEETWRVMR